MHTCCIPAACSPEFALAASQPAAETRHSRVKLRIDQSACFLFHFRSSSFYVKTIHVWSVFTAAIPVFQNNIFFLVFALALFLLEKKFILGTLIWLLWRNVKQVYTKDKGFGNPRWFAVFFTALKVIRIGLYSPKNNPLSPCEDFLGPWHYSLLSSARQFSMCICPQNENSYTSKDEK